MIFGPEQAIERIDSQINAVTWGRIEDNAPVFEIFEIHGAILKGARLRPNLKAAALPGQAVQAGIILAGEHFRVRDVVCDHAIPSVAYAMDFHPKFKFAQKSVGQWCGFDFEIRSKSSDILIKYRFHPIDAKDCFLLKGTYDLAHQWTPQ